MPGFAKAPAAETDRGRAVLIWLLSKIKMRKVNGW
jgi:hypothetical protein